LCVSQKIAPNGHAFTQFSQPMQRFLKSSTPPPWRILSASTGQTLAQGGSAQARHTMTTNPRLTPPAEWTPMHADAKPPSPVLRAQANMHIWQPTHRSTSTTDSLLAMRSPFFPGKQSNPAPLEPNYKHSQSSLHNIPRNNYLGKGGGCPEIQYDEKLSFSLHASLLLPHPSRSCYQKAAWCQFRDQDICQVS
jgi:hypothetical protein